MTSMNFIGFFQKQEVLLKARNSFEIAGFKPNGLIVQDSEDYPLMLCVKVNDEYDLRMANNIFRFYGVTHIDELNTQIENAEELRRIISIHSRQQIFTPKAIATHKHFHEGMNAEIQSFPTE